ncbi:MAG: hypothetical protein VX373_09375, partial [Pseudomonadota bacterium]|nr:hypothetical protein [Pseudomonadota bacterium]
MPSLTANAMTAFASGAFEDTTFEPLITTEEMVEAMKTADANCTQLVDTLLFNQFTRMLTIAVPRSLLVESKDSDPW